MNLNTRLTQVLFDQLVTDSSCEKYNCWRGTGIRHYGRGTELAAGVKAGSWVLEIVLRRDETVFSEQTKPIIDRFRRKLGDMVSSLGEGKWVSKTQDFDTAVYFLCELCLLL